MLIKKYLMRVKKHFHEKFKEQTLVRLLFSSLLLTIIYETLYSAFSGEYWHPSDFLLFDEDFSRYYRSYIISISVLLLLYKVAKIPFNNDIQLVITKLPKALFISVLIFLLLFVFDSVFFEDTSYLIDWLEEQTILLSTLFIISLYFTKQSEAVPAKFFLRNLHLVFIRSALLGLFIGYLLGDYISDYIDVIPLTSPLYLPYVFLFVMVWNLEMLVQKYKVRASDSSGVLWREMPLLALVYLKLYGKTVENSRVKLNLTSLVGRIREWYDEDKSIDSKLKLEAYDLNEIDIQGEEIDSVDFKNSSVNSAIARQTTFRNCDLSGVTFYDSDMSDSIFENCRFLTAEQFAGCNLSGANLPVEFEKTLHIEMLAEISISAKKVFFTLIFASLYCWITIAGTTDAELVLNAGKAELPFIGIKISTASFYVVAPLLLLIVHIYLHLILHRFWREISKMPAIFQDGRAIDERGFGWLLIAIFRQYLPVLKRHPVKYHFLGTWFPSFITFWLVPITLAVFWQNNLPSHHMGALIIQIVLISGTWVFSYRSKRNLIDLLKYKQNLNKETLRESVVKWIEDAKTSLLIFVSLLILMISAFGSFSANNQIRFEGYQGIVYSFGSNEFISDDSLNIPQLATILLSFQGKKLTADLSNSLLTSVPSNWEGDSIDDFTNIKGPVFDNRELVGINFQNTFMPKAIFTASALTGADFSNTDLRKAHFGGRYSSSLGWGLLFDAKDVALGYKAIDGYTLGSIDNVNFNESRMRFAILIGFFLTNTTFIQTDMRETKIGFERIDSSFFLGTDLRNAKLRGLVSSETVFYGARLEGADLSMVQGLTSKQIAFVSFDEDTIFPEGLSIPEKFNNQLNKYGYFNLYLELTLLRKKNHDLMRFTNMSDDEKENVLDEYYNLAKGSFTSSDRLIIQLEDSN